MDQQLLGRRIGAYLIVREVARRGVAVLFEAVHLDKGVAVMVKVLCRVAPDDPAYRRYTERLFQEARALAEASHPSLPKIFDFGQLEDGTAYLMTEHRRGAWLGERLARSEGPLQLGEATAILRQLAGALAKLPVHFDLSPEDLVLYPDEGAPGGRRAWLADLGVVPLLSGSRLPVAPTGSLLPGESTYLAPELCRGGQPDERTTVYALGILAYRMLSGDAPFSGSAFAVRGHHLQTPPPPLAERAPGLPDELVALVHAMLAKDPAARPTLADVAAALEPAREGEAPVRAGEAKVREGEPRRSQPSEAPRRTPLSGLRAVLPAAEWLPISELPQEYERLRRGVLLLRQLLDGADGRERVVRLLDGAGALVPADRGALLRREGGRFTLLAARRFRAVAGAQDLTEVPERALQELESRGAVLSADATLDDRFDYDRRVIGDGVRSLLAVPLRRGGELWGALYLDSQLAAGLFSARDRELLSLLSDAALR